jgi:hypothetical protein
MNNAVVSSLDELSRNPDHPPTNTHGSISAVCGGPLGQAAEHDAAALDRGSARQLENTRM